MPLPELGSGMRRREFIGLVGSVAAAWPVAASAQQSDRMRRVGVLSGGRADDPEIQARVTAFVQALQQMGWTDGRNVRIDYRWGEGNADTIRKSTAELVALSPDVILTPGGPAMERLRQVTRTIPIVFVITPDPVGGSSYVSNELATWLGDNNMRHTRGAPHHPMTQGKIER
jgi:putative ABC transport system substrate-binding protein